MFERKAIDCPRCRDVVRFVEKYRFGLVARLFGGFFRAIVEPFEEPYCRSCGLLQLEELPVKIRRAVVRARIVSTVVLSLLVLALFGMMATGGLK